MSNSPAISSPDLRRIDFLKHLDEATEIDVTDWEAAFIESFITNPRPMTQSQREAADSMETRYGDRM